MANSISALENDSRRTDIFVGVDVFGRGCLGGGGFQCDQVIICSFLCLPIRLINSQMAQSARRKLKNAFIIRLSEKSGSEDSRPLFLPRAGLTRSRTGPGPRSRLTRHTRHKRKSSGASFLCGSTPSGDYSSHFSTFMVLIYSLPASPGREPAPAPTHVKI